MLKLQIIVIAIFIVILILTMLIIKYFNLKTHIKKTQSQKERPEHNILKRYCDDKNNDERRAIANYILIHDKSARKKRGQKNSL